MSGVKGRSGRKPGFFKSINQYLEANRRNIPQLLEELTSQALKTRKIPIKCPHCALTHDHEVRGYGDIEAIKYLLDRHYGKTPQAIDLTARVVSLSGDDLAKLIPELVASALPVIEGEYRVIDGLKKPRLTS